MAYKVTREEFVKRAIAVHHDKYDYSDIEFMNMDTDVKIFCKQCQKYFTQNRPNM